MKRYFVALSLILAVCVTTGLVAINRLPAQEKELPVDTRNFMQAKLKHAQKILEGLSLENYDIIVKNAQELSLLSLESHWNVLRTQQYIDQSAEFRHSIERLIEAANTKKIDATALSYMDVTLKCIHCHKYVRSGAAAGKESIGSTNADRVQDSKPSVKASP